MAFVVQRVPLGKHQRVFLEIRILYIKMFKLRKSKYQLKNIEDYKIHLRTVVS
jgi:hypothetical protein